MKFLEEFKLPKNFEINLLIKTFLGLVEMMFGLVNVSFSLPKWQAVKMIFFAPCCTNNDFDSHIKLMNWNDGLVLISDNVAHFIISLE